MSENLSANRNFLLLLLTTTPNQARHLLKSITSQQSLAIAEIAFNLQNTVQNQKVHNLLKNRLHFLEKISLANSQKRIQNIKKYNNFLYNLLSAVKPELLSLLE